MRNGLDSRSQDISRLLTQKYIKYIYIYILYYIIIYIYIYILYNIYIYVYIYVYSCSQKMDAVQKFVVGCQRAAVANDCVVD